MKVSVIGLGYVGLTVAIGAASSGNKVVGYDINSLLIKDLKVGKTSVPGISANLLRSLILEKIFSPTSDPSEISDSEVVVIAVPTPLNRERKPELKYLNEAANLIVDNLDVGALIINESTSFPGTLRNYIKPIFDKKSKFDFKFAAAPERVDPGNLKWTLSNTPRLISGLDNEATDLASSFYATFCEKIFKVSSPEVAEAAKLFENTFRQVNIALVNEFAEISNKLGFSAHEAISGAATKPFGFMPFYPGIGVGGHCIPIDPSYLSYAAEIVGMEASFINLSNKINLSMPAKVVTRIKNELGKDLRGKRIQLAGISYKSNIPDLRESPALQLIQELENSGATISWFDNFVLEYGNRKSVLLDPRIDLGLIITPHDGMDFSVWKNAGTRVLDLSANSINYGWPKFL